MGFGVTSLTIKIPLFIVMDTKDAISHAILLHRLCGSSDDFNCILHSAEFHFN